MVSEKFAQTRAIIDKVILPRYDGDDREVMISLYRKWSTIGEIALQFHNSLDNLAILETAVRIVIISVLGEDEYNTLSIGKWWRQQKLQKRGIHSPDFDNTKAWSKWALAIGRQPYAPAEDARLLELSKEKEFIKGRERYHTEPLSLKLQQEGYPLRTPKWISARLSRLLAKKEREK